MRHLFTFIVVLSYCYSFSQNTDYADRIEHVFGNINKSKVTTGYLKEFGIRFNEIEAYNGTMRNDNLVDQTQWQSLYSSLFTMRVGTAAQNMTAPNIVFNNLQAQQENSSAVLLAAQFYNYQQYKSDAYTNGDVTISNERIYDVAGRNPYVTKTAFGVAPLKNELQGSTFSFKLPSLLIYSNSGLSLSQVQVDFGNGQGYQSISLNTAKNVTYNSGGEKEIKVKFAYSGGPALYSHSKIWVDYVSSGNPQARFTGSGATAHSITGNNWQGSSATGTITVETAGTDGIFDKPLIVVEGFDPQNTFDYFDLINGIGPGGIKTPLGGGITLNQAIEDEDYDLVFVDFENSTDFIQRNAYMAEEVINWVNNNKVGNEQNVVLGMSMGGLVARYALRHMEIENESHDTKLYISHDAPHQGANLPLSVQAMLRHLVGEEISIPFLIGLFDINLVDLNDLVPQLNEGIEILQSPAAQQMLIYQLQGTGDNVSVTNNTLHNSFSTEYSNMGYPQQGGIRNIAISNGSECGTSLDFEPYDPLVYINESIDLPYLITNVFLTILNGITLNPFQVVSSILSTDTDIKVQFDAKALPNNQNREIYKGKIFIEKTVLFVIDIEEPLIDEEKINSSSTMLPLDNSSGGIYDLEFFTDLPEEMDEYIIERRFNFIPTYSSLDIGNGNQPIYYNDLIEVYTPLSPPEAPKDSPFDNFFTNPVSSGNHIQFTLNNGNWLIDELQNEEALSFCLSSCSPPSSPISGPGQVCTSATYSIPGYSGNINWSTSNSNIATINSNGVLTKQGDGEIILTANIDGDCGDLTLEKEVYVGKPVPHITYTIEEVPNKPYLYHFNSNVPEREFFNYQWSVYINGTTLISTGNETTFSHRLLCNIDYNIEIEVSSTCGSNNDQMNLTGRCLQINSSYIIYPNPANNQFTIDLSRAEVETNQKQKENLLYEITITNQMGSVVRQLETQSQKTIVDISDLMPGAYFVIIQNGKEVIKETLIIE